MRSLEIKRIRGKIPKNTKAVKRKRHKNALKNLMVESSRQPSLKRIDRFNGPTPFWIKH
jgi:hypothetical protein